MAKADTACICFFFFQAEDGIRDRNVTGVQTCALPISRRDRVPAAERRGGRGAGPRLLRGLGRRAPRPTGRPPPGRRALRPSPRRRLRSEEHTAELQSRFDLVCRLLLLKKNIDW